MTDYQLPISGQDNQPKNHCIPICNRMTVGFVQLISHHPNVEILQCLSSLPPIDNLYLLSDYWSIMSPCLHYAWAKVNLSHIMYVPCSCHLHCLNIKLYDQWM